MLLPLWFVRDLMVVSVLTPLIYWLIRRFRFWPVVVLGLCYIFDIFIPLHGFSAVCFFWFSLGAYLSIWKKDIVIVCQRFKYPAYVVTLLTLILLTWTWGSNGASHFSLCGECLRQLSSLYILSSIISAVNLAAYFVGKRRVRVNHWLAKTSFFIFALHIMVLECVWPRIVPWVGGDTWRKLISFPLVPLFVTAVCLGLYWLLERFAPRLL